VRPLGRLEPAEVGARKRAVRRPRVLELDVSRRLVALIPITLQPVPSLAQGVAALNAGRAEDAVMLLERAAVAEPRSRLVLLHLANAQRAARRYTAAATTLRELLRLDAGDKLALSNLASLKLTRRSRHCTN
jgi:Flp pilus assembly protein TadD